MRSKRPLLGIFILRAKMQGSDPQPIFKNQKLKIYFSDTCTFAQLRKCENVQK
jgi:hypothetical protein